MPRILFPFTRAKLNSIARLAGEKLQNKQEGNQLYLLWECNKDPGVFLWTSSTGECVHVLAWSCDPIFAHMITKIIKLSFSILNLCSTLSSTLRDTTDQKCSLGLIIYSIKLKFRIFKRLKKSQQNYYPKISLCIYSLKM